ncbi:MAG: hypothetical protein IJM83_05290 [Firmicutes bacterium]|nr:hypothetical protein [Bacillota bacterium]
MFFGLFPLIFAIIVINAVSRIARASKETTPRRITQVDSVVRDVPETKQAPARQAQPQAQTVARSAKIQSIAADAAKQEQKIPVQSKRLYDIVHQTFGAQSMTGQKYLSIVSAAYDKIRANHQTMLRQMQAFDEQEYVRLSQMIQNGWHQYDNIDDTIQTEQLGLFGKQIEQMTEELNANERIFLFLEKLSLELQSMSSTKENQATLDLLNEIQSLIGDVKYYS